MDNIKIIVDWISMLAIPGIILLFLGFGYFKKVKVYEKFVEGAKEGFQVGIRIIPFLVAMLVAIAMLRASGALEWLIWGLGKVTLWAGIPPEVLPMALMRPLSGSGSIGVMTEIMQTYGVDSLLGITASTMFGSTETTFYVVAVYFGAVNIRKTRYALPAGLLADLAGLLTAVWICRFLYA